MRFALVPLLFTFLHAQENKKEENKDDFPSVVSKQDAVTIAGKKIDYKVTASTLSLKTAKDEDRASIFHVAYERIGMSDRHKRPIVFAFNGGPGSSAVWLHMGALGPRIVPTTPDGTRTLPHPLPLKRTPNRFLMSLILFLSTQSRLGFHVQKEKRRLTNSMESMETSARSVISYAAG